MKPPSLHPQTIFPTTLKNLVNLAILVIILVIFACCSSSVPGSYKLGSIVFRSDLDCEIRLFTIDSTQIARGFSEPDKAPFIVTMKEPGEYLLVAEAAEPVPAFAPVRRTVQKTITYRSGNIDYYIEFY